MVRRATKADLPAIFALMNRCVAPPWREETLNSAFDCDRNDLFVAEIGGKTAGYIIAENVLDEGCITSVAVDEEYRRRGLGKALVAYALAQSRAASVYLEVNERNTPAIALYATCGFARVGERKKYYGIDSAIVMRREMSS